MFRKTNNYACACVRSSVDANETFRMPADVKQSTIVKLCSQVK